MHLAVVKIQKIVGVDDRQHFLHAPIGACHLPLHQESFLPIPGTLPFSK
jgi:hypothetical protein